MGTYRIKKQKTPPRPPPSIIKMNKGKLTTLDYFRIQNCIFITIILPHKFRFVSNFLD